MTKTTIKFLSAICFLILLSWLSFKLLNNKGKSDLELIDFSIADTSKITQIIITDPASNKISLVNKKVHKNTIK